MTTYTVPEVLDDADLITSLSAYAASQKPREDADAKTKTESSKLLLRVITAADYFTENKKLMTNPEPVYVDLILDPFLFNVLPRSLVPTVGYIAALVPVAWVVARWVSGAMVRVARGGEDVNVKKHN